jgi:hypothetical protein
MIMVWGIFFGLAGLLPILGQDADLVYKHYDRLKALWQKVMVSEGKEEFRKVIKEDIKVTLDEIGLADDRTTEGIFIYNLFKAVPEHPGKFVTINFRRRRYEEGATEKLIKALKQLRKVSQQEHELLLQRIYLLLRKMGAIKAGTPPWKEQRYLQLIKAMTFKEGYPEWPEPEPELRERINRLIKMLGHKEPKVRLDAQRELEKIGPGAVGSLFKAFRNKQDLEVKRSVLDLLEKLEEE